MSAPLPSAVELLARMRRDELSSEQLVAELLARIEAVNPRLNAVADMDAEAALQAARAADARLAAGDPAPLLGLPVTLKDSIDAVGLRCTGGSFARAGFRPTRDATVTARLRAAGAIILAKTNLPEYSSSYETDSALLGRCNHPLDPARTPGGSSGGEGALLGAGGYGQPILTGIRLSDTPLILEGAVPAAGLALLAQGLFELIERWCVPRGLRNMRAD